MNSLGIPVSTVTRSYRQASQNYSRMSMWYDISEGLFERYFVQLGIQLLDLHDKDDILEIGCGTASALLQIQNTVQRGRIVGVDLAKGMIDQGKRKIRKKSRQTGLHNIELVHGNFLDEQLLTSEKQFDKIFMSFVLELFSLDDILKVLQKCTRLLRDEGRLVVVALNKGKKRQRLVEIYEYFHALYPIQIDCRPIPVRELLQHAGFEISKYRVLSMWGLPVCIAEGIIQ